MLNLNSLKNPRSVLSGSQEMFFKICCHRRESEMEDRKLTCRDCGVEFVFTVGEQEFYKEKGFENDPVRCPDCRRARKMQRNNREY